MITSEIDLISSIDFQLANLWDFIIIDDNPILTSNIGQSIANIANSVANSIGGVPMKFKVTSNSVPLPSLVTESTKVGKKHYVGREYEGDFQITILEDTFFSSYNYFDAWMNKIYNFEDQTWRQNPPTRTGLLMYYASVLTIPTAIFMYRNLKIKGIESISQQRTTSEPLSLTVSLTFEQVTKVTTSSLVSSLQNLLFK